jgi:hypothetical protein
VYFHSIYVFRRDIPIRRNWKDLVVVIILYYCTKACQHKKLIDTLISTESRLKANFKTSRYLMIEEIMVTLSDIFEFV